MVRLPNQEFTTIPILLLYRDRSELLTYYSIHANGVLLQANVG